MSSEAQPIEQQPASPRADKPGVPAFAREFPEDPKLRELLEAFERGQYNVVREQAPALASSTSDPRVAEAARELRRRIEPDPLARKLLVGSILLLVFLTLLAFTELHP